MANFNDLALTVNGVKALLAAQTGMALKLSKIGMGSGSTTNSTKLTKLVTPKLMLPISEKKTDGESGLLTIIAKMTNEDLTEGFYWRETGLFFEDSAGNDVLFAYACVTDQYDYVPAYSDQRYVKHIRIANIITDSANVTVQEREGLLYVDTLTFSEFKENLISHIGNKSNPHGVTKAQVGLGNVDNTSDANKPVSTLQQAALDTYYQQSVGYTDNKIADLINGAPETLDTLKEVADAIQENETIVEALDAAIGNKANQSELDTHTGNETIHITAKERNKWNSIITDLTNNYYNKETCEEYYYKKSDVDTKFDEIFIHNTVELKAGRPIYLYPSRLTGYKLISASTNNSASYVKMFALGDNVDTIELSAIPEKDCKLYLTYVKCLY